MGNEVFYCCPNLKSIALPNKLEVIPRRTFWKCHSLAQVVIPNSVKVIEENATLKKFFLPSSKYIAEYFRQS